MDEQRALLDSLMGINRNQDRAEEVVTDYRDERVCKYFLHGICPSDLFLNTKSDVGTCSMMHSEEMKEAFERALQDKHKGAHAAMFDADMERKLTGLVSDVEKRISRERAKLEEVGTSERMVEPELQPEVILLTLDIEDQCDIVERLADQEDNVDAARRAFDDLEAMEQEKREALRRHSANRFLAGQGTQKLKVCHICGSHLSLTDGDSRLGDHFQGKQHEGYKLIRLFVDKMHARRGQRDGRGDQKYEPQPPPGRDERWDERDRDGRDAGRDRSRDRGERYDPRDRGYGPDRGRDDRYRGGYDDRGRDDRGYQKRDSRDRDRDGSKGGYRPRSRSRDRDVGRDRGRGGRW